MRCHNCGAEVKEWLRVCPECGATMHRPGLLHRSMHCASCQARVPAGLSICPYCGARLRRSWRVPVLAVMSLLLVVGLVYALRTYVPWKRVYALRERVKIPALAFLATPTNTPSPTPRRTATPTPTVTPTFTPSPSPLPQTDTPEPSPTVRKLTPTSKPILATNTPQPRFATPQLLEPAAQTEFRGGSQIKLSWQAAGTLADDEWYALSVRFMADGVVQYSGTWTKDTSWILPAGLYTKAGQTERAFQWDVTVMKQTGTRPDGGREGVTLSATSETRTFFWY
jgi:RNA polymerase subunit RPABC4/transcription elongation factor Spt4